MEKINDAYILRHDIVPNYKQVYLFCSDIHYDSKHCDRDLLKKDFDAANNMNAKILIFGDLFDAMGGKFDKRTSKDDIRPEYNRGAYFDDIVSDFIEWSKPYKDNIIFISDGNHEISVKKIHEIDLIERTIQGLNPKILHGKYAGFIRFMFSRNEGNRSSKLLYYVHGSGGNAPVTKNSIKTNRRQDAIQADFYISGHVHTEFHIPRTQTRLNQNNVKEITKVHHWQLGTYKNDHLNGDFADMKEFAAPNLGGLFLEWYYDNDGHSRVDFKTYLSKY